MLLPQPEDVQGPVDVDVVDLHRMLDAETYSRLAGLMEDYVHVFHGGVQPIDVEDVTVDEPEPRVVDRACKVPLFPRVELVEAVVHRDGRAHPKQPFRQVGSDESGTSGD